MYLAWEVREIRKGAHPHVCDLTGSPEPIPPHSASDTPIKASALRLLNGGIHITGDLLSRLTSYIKLSTYAKKQQYDAVYYIAEEFFSQAQNC